MKPRTNYLKEPTPFAGEIVHVRKDYTNNGLCGRQAVATVSSAWGFWGRTGDGFQHICPECFKLQTGEDK